MPSHIKHMDKMHKISAISNSPLSLHSVGMSFIAQNSLLKNSKFHGLTRITETQLLNPNH